MRMVSIASGSSGNCIYVGSDETHILIDAGISNKRIEKGLNEIGVTGNDLDGILITHEHSDHIKGLGVLARKYGTPIYSTKETLEEIGNVKSLGDYPRELFRPICHDVDFYIGDLEIKPFRIDHDAANPVAYRVQNNRRSVAVATDMGHYSKMLEAGPYPYYLKRRILGDYGHLSNENAGRLLNCILHDNLKHIFLGHLSKENNYEELAYETVRLEISQGDSPYTASDFPITVAKRDEMSPIVTL